MWRGEKSCPYQDSNSDPSVVQFVAIRYTDWAIPAPWLYMTVWCSVPYLCSHVHSTVLCRVLQTMVYCLMRESPGLTAVDRIRSSLRKFGIAEFDENLELRIIPIKGAFRQRCSACHIQCEGQSLYVTDVMNAEFGTSALLVMILNGDVGRSSLCVYLYCHVSQSNWRVTCDLRDTSLNSLHRHAQNGFIWWRVITVLLNVRHTFSGHRHRKNLMCIQWNLW
jgi:hypothetical protein